MSATFVQKTSKFTASSASSVTSAGITTSSGNFAVTTAAVYNSGPITVGLSDSKSNTWVVDADEANGSIAHVIIGSARLTNSGGSHTFTVTSSAGGSYFEGNTTEVSGVETVSPKDASATGGASTMTATVTTGATTQADEIVFAAIAFSTGSANVGVSDPPTGYTSIGVNQDHNTTVGYEAAYKNVSSTGAQSATWNWSANNVTAAAVVTYKSGAGGGGGSILPKVMQYM